MTALNNNGEQIDPSVYAVNCEMLGGPAGATIPINDGETEQTGWQLRGGYHHTQEEVAACLEKVRSHRVSVSGAIVE